MTPTPSAGTASPAAPADARGAAVTVDVRRTAVDDLEAAFSELVTQFRRIALQAAGAAGGGLQPGVLKLLVATERQGPITASCLAERLRTDKGFISRSLGELEERGLVERSADPGDRRARLVEVTPAGRERVTAARIPFEHVIESGVRDWPVDAIERLTDLLRELAAGVAPRDSAR
ncbi:MAG: MarR family winged helix-turn-helix transcriptional regulator [Microbacteriaceae bacterium]